MFWNDTILTHADKIIYIQNLMPLEYNFILLTERIFNTNLELHSMHIKFCTAFRNHTVHLMDLDSSYGLFIE
jgi:hypothetical protein